MVKVDIQEADHRRKDREDDHVIHFVEYYAKHTDYHGRCINIEPRDIPGSQSTFDYAVTALRLAIEVKGIYREEDEKASCRRAMTGIRNALNEDIDTIQGTYRVVVPHDFNLKTKGKRPRKELKELKDKIHSAIKSSINKVIYEPYGKFEISKVSDEGTRIQVFQKPRNYGGPVGVACDKLEMKGAEGSTHKPFDEEIMRCINSAERQLEIAHPTEFKKRICLLVSRDIVCQVPRGFILVFASHYRKMLNLHNIDEIWLISNYPEHRIDLLYERTFISSFQSHTLTASEQNVRLFELWFPELKITGQDHDRSLIAALKNLLKDKPVHTVFPDISTRYECVYFAKHLTEKKNYDDATWLAKRLIDDPDPPEPGSESCEEDLELHHLVALGEHPTDIRTILALLCLVLQDIAMSKDHLRDAFYLTVQMAKHNNLYIKLHTLIPLGIISQRRPELTGYGDKPYRGQYGEFRRIIHGYKILVKNFPNCKAIAEDLYEWIPDADDM